MTMHPGTILISNIVIVFIYFMHRMSEAQTELKCNVSEAQAELIKGYNVMS